MSRPAARVVNNDSVSESVDLLQMLIAPPPPPPPPPQSTSRPAVPSRHVEDGTTAPPQRPRSGEQMCYRTCHACVAEEQRYRQQQPAECAYCSCSQARVDPRLQRADLDDTTASIYFNPRGLVPPGAPPACMWPRRPTPPVRTREFTLSAPRIDVGSTSESTCTVQAGCRRRDDDVGDNDDYDVATGKRTMSTSLSSRASSRTPRLRGAAEICRRARRAAAITECCLPCWPRLASANPTAAASSGSNTTTDVDRCIDAPHDDLSQPATAKLGSKLSLRRGSRCKTQWNLNADRRRTIVLVVGFLLGLFLVSTALLTGFVLLWPSHRRRLSTSGTI